MYITEKYTNKWNQPPPQKKWLVSRFFRSGFFRRRLGNPWKFSGGGSRDLQVWDMCTKSPKKHTLGSGIQIARFSGGGGEISTSTNSTQNKHPYIDPKNPIFKRKPCHLKHILMVCSSSQFRKSSHLGGQDGMNIPISPSTRHPDGNSAER